MKWAMKSVYLFTTYVQEGVLLTQYSMDPAGDIGNLATYVVISYGWANTAEQLFTEVAGVLSSPWLNQNQNQNPS